MFKFIKKQFQVSKYNFEFPEDELMANELVRQIEAFVPDLHKFFEFTNTKDDQQVFNQLVDDFLEKVVDLESQIKEKKLISRIKIFFRECIHIYLSKSKFVFRGLDKPRGYPGDFLMLEHMYNQSCSTDGIGKYFDQYFLTDHYVQAVIVRKNRIKDMLLNFIENWPASDVNVFNIACGACREIREIFEENLINDCKKNISFLLVDQDGAALNYAQSQLAKFSSSKLSFSYLSENVAKFYEKKDEFRQLFRSKDFIYSIGLADYLPDSILYPLVNFSLSLLNKGGRFILAHKNVEQFGSPASDWFCNWNFIPREIDDVVAKVKEFSFTSEFQLETFFDENQMVYYLDFLKS